MATHTNIHIHIYVCAATFPHQGLEFRVRETLFVQKAFPARNLNPGYNPCSYDAHSLEFSSVVTDSWLCLCPHRCLYLCLYLCRCLRVRTVGDCAEAKIEITLKERLQGYFYPTHRITDTFLSTPLQNMEREWIRVMGSLSEPLTAQSMAQFLTFVLVDHPNPINKYNCKELCSLFDKRLDAQV